MGQAYCQNAGVKQLRMNRVAEIISESPIIQKTTGGVLAVFGGMSVIDYIEPASDFIELTMAVLGLLISIGAYRLQRQRRKREQVETENLRIEQEILKSKLESYDDK